jgi:kynurenine formamidase
MKMFLQMFTLGMALFAFGQGLRAGVLEDVMKGKATVIDMTYPLNEKNAYWPVGPYTPFRYEVIANLKKDKVFSGKYSTPEHLGTHLDAPNHFEEGLPSVDQIPFEQLVGPAVVINVTDKAEKDADYTLSPSDILLWEKDNGQIPEGAIVLLNTGWSKRWNSYEDYKNHNKDGRMHFPGFSKEAATYLVTKKSIRGIGIDTLSGDCGISTDFQVHHTINAAGKFIVENVTNLDKLPPKGATLIIAPIKIEGGSGGQCRIWAILPELSPTKYPK